MDCKAMSEAIVSVTAPICRNQTMAGWFNKLSQYDFEIYYLPGKKNILPDLCSCVHYINAVTTKDGVSITDAEVKQLIYDAHAIGHFGVNGMYDHIHTTLGIRGIPHLKKRLLEYCSSCKVCGEVNNWRVGYSSLQVPLTLLPGERWLSDLMEMTKSTFGCVFILVVVDELTHFIWLFALTNKFDEAIAACFLKVCTNFGFSRCIKTDNSKEFHNSFVEAVRLCGNVAYDTTIAHNHHANSIAKC
jgi:hypothetical protein